MFAPVSKKHRLFRAQVVARQARGIPSLPLEAPARQARGGAAGVSSIDATERRRIAFGELHQQFVEQYAPPSLIVNAEYEIVHLSENVGRFLRRAGGEPSVNLVKEVLPELRLELRTALFQAMQTGRSTEARRVSLELEGHRVYVNMIVRPSRATEGETSYALVLFVETEEALGEEGKESPDGKQDAVVSGLEEEAQRLKDQLQATIEQYETTVEELKSSNEEMQSVNEEVRSTSEELETSKEELQSVNEELRTVNQELKNKVEEVTDANADLKNLIASTEIATVFLDRSLRIKRYTPRATELFSLIPTDLGRPLADITHRLEYENLHRDAEDVIANLSKIEREVRSADKRFLIARFSPYRTLEDRIGGVVISFIDVTEREETAQLVSEERAYAEAIVETVREPLIVLDQDLCVVSASRSFYETFRVAPEETEKEFIYNLGNRQWDIPALRELLEDILPQKSQFQDFEVEHNFETIGRRTMLLNAREVRRDGGERRLILLAIEDITERKLAEETLRASEERLQKMVNVPSVGVLTFDYAGALLDANDAFLEMVGYTREEFAPGKFSWRDFTPPEYVEASEAVMKSLLETNRSGPYEKEYFRKDGSQIWFMFVASNLGDGTIVEYAVDITSRKRTEAVQESQRMALERLARGDSLGEVTEFLISTIEEHSAGRLVGSVALLDETESQFIASIGPGLPDSYHNAVEGMLVSSQTGTCCRAVLERQAATVADVTVDPQWSRFAAFIAPLGFRSASSTLIVGSDGKILGTFANYGRTPQQATAQDLAFVDGITRTVALVIERKRAEEALRESEARLTADLAGMRRLYELYARLSNETDLHAALDEIIRAACEFTKTERGCIQLVSPDGERLEMFAWRGYADSSPFINHFRHEGSKVACDAARRRGERLIIEDIENFPPLEGTRDREVALAENIRATQSTPMVSRRGDMVGVLNNQFAEPHRPTDDELRLIDLLAWMAADFVARHRAEQALRESEERLRALVENLPGSAVFILNREMRYLVAEGEALAAAGFAPADLVGRTIYEALPPELTADYESNFQNALAGKAFEYEHQAHDRSFISRGVPLRDAAGEVYAVLAISYDITERKRAEGQLRESEERFRAAFEQANVGIVQASAGGRLLTVNPGFCKIIGYPEEEARGMMIRDITHPDDYEKEEELTRRLVAGEISGYTLEKRFLRKDGGVIWGQMTATLVRRESGEPYYLLSIVEDISERKRAEGALKQLNEELEGRVAERTVELMEMNSNLQAEITERKRVEQERAVILRRLVMAQEDERRRIARDMHDQFGQQLTALLLKLGMLKEDCRGQEELRGQVESLESVARQLDRDVDFLVWELRPTVLDDLGLREALANFAQNWSEHFGIPVEVHTSGMGKGRLTSETETVLYRIVQEALNNISKHARAASVNILLEQRADFISLIVEDDGAGFDDEEMFGANDKGLGLVGMRERAALVGGTTEIESRPGEGTTVIVRIPAPPIPTRGEPHE